MVVLLWLLVLAPDFPLFGIATVKSAAWTLGSFKLTPVAMFISSFFSFFFFLHTTDSVNKLVLPSKWEQKVT